MGRRRFAGDQLSSLQSFSPDVLAAATTALKQQSDAKSASGNRLGPGSQQERDEAAAQAPAVPSAAGVSAPTGAVTPTTLSQSDITSLKSSLGIDKLETALSLGALSLSAFKNTPQTTLPKFEFPKFEMPTFTMPTFSLPENLTASAAKTQTEPATAEATTIAQPQQQIPASTVLQVGSKTYNPAKIGGPGLSGKDIKKLQNKGWTTKEIKQAVAQAPQVSSGVQKLLNASKEKAKDQAKTITAKATKAVAKNAAKQSSSKKK